MNNRRTEQIKTIANQFIFDAEKELGPIPMLVRIQMINDCIEVLKNNKRGKTLKPFIFYNEQYFEKEYIIA